MPKVFKQGVGMTVCNKGRDDGIDNTKLNINSPIYGYVFLT